MDSKFLRESGVGHDSEEDLLDEHVLLFSMCRCCCFGCALTIGNALPSGATVLDGIRVLAVERSMRLFVGLDVFAHQASDPSRDGNGNTRCKTQVLVLRTGELGI